MPIEVAARDPELLPPYDGCRHGTCECRADVVLASEEVPPGTRVVERVPEGERRSDEQDTDFE